MLQWSDQVAPLFGTHLRKSSKCSISSSDLKYDRLTPAVVTSTNMRFLCLHGRGTNADIFEHQLRRLKCLSVVHCESALISSPQAPSNHVWRPLGPVTSISSMLSLKTDRHLESQTSFHHLTSSGIKVVRRPKSRSFTTISGR